MPTEQEVYAQHAPEYEALVAHEDYQGNILRTIRAIMPPEGLSLLDLGAGTGRLACLLQSYARSVIACDLSLEMLKIARGKLRRGTHNWLAAGADHRHLPLKGRSADLIVSGWSVSYVTVWHPDSWREQAEAWLAEALRVLRPGGCIILFESLGTGNTLPQRLPHLENFYQWLDEKRFLHFWIRTDYRFESAEAAAQIAGFFFGEAIKDKIVSAAPDQDPAILPECTGVWWLHA